MDRSSSLRCRCQSVQPPKIRARLERHTIFSCPECTLAWTTPPPGPIKYEQGDFHQCVDSSANAVPSVSQLPGEWQNSLRLQVELLKKHLKPGAHVHEVGSGRGLALQLFREAGFSVSAVEPSERAAAIAQQQGFAVETGYFGAGNRIATADCVVFSHVLEHIAEPEAVLDHAADLVGDGYLLFFQTHYPGWIPRIFVRHWAWIPDEHFWHFTPKALDGWLARVGFSRVELCYVPLVQGNWKTKLVRNLASLIPPAQDGFIALYRRNPPPPNP